MTDRKAKSAVTTLGRTAAALTIAGALALAPLGVLAQDTPAPASDPAAAAPATPPAPPAQPDPNAVVANVGDETITEADLGFAAEDLAQELQQVRQARPHRLLLRLDVQDRLVVAGRVVELVVRQVNRGQAVVREQVVRALRQRLQSMGPGDLTCSKNVCSYGGAEYAPSGYLFFHPTTYMDERGHPRMRMRHLPFVIDQAARDAWFEHMAAAVRDSPAPDAAQAEMLEYFDRAATFLMNA